MDYRFIKFAPWIMTASVWAYAKRLPLGDPWARSWGTLDASPRGQHTWNDLASLIEVTRKTGISVAFLENGKRTEYQCIQELCFQVIRECTTNTIRHAQEASQITVSLDFSPHSVRIHFSDNGKLQTSVVKPGNGILGMRRRLEKVGGSLTASSTRRGWKVDAIIPIYPGSREGNTSAERYK